MNDLAHCKMNDKDIGEYMDFYDFSSENERIIRKYFLSGKFKNLNLTKKDLEDFEIVELNDENEIKDNDEWVDVSNEENEEESME